MIVLPWMADWIGGHTVRLTAGPDGTAIGRFVDSTEYMMMRSQRPEPADLTGLNHHGRQEEAAMDPRRVVFASWGADIAIAGLLPDVSGTYEADGERFRLLAWTSDSQLTVDCVPDQQRPLVRENGPRQLCRKSKRRSSPGLAMADPPATGSASPSPRTTCGHGWTNPARCSLR